MRFLSFLATTVFLALLASGFVASLLLFNGRTIDSSEPSVAGEVEETVHTSDSSITVNVLQLDGDEKTILSCEQSRCSKQLPPDGEDRALFDGNAWYHYNDEGQLLRTSGDDSDLLIEPSRIAAPRDLFISPLGDRLAFWLDNTGEPAKQRTELWMYDSAILATRLLAENIHQPGVITKPRWNTAGSLVWFIGNTAGRGEDKRSALHVVTAHPPGLSLKFDQLDWNSLESIANDGLMDINQSGDKLAYADGNTITIATQSEKKQKTLRGPVVYLQWINNDSLIYAARDVRGTTFWEQKGEVSQHILFIPGALQSARATTDGSLLAAVGSNKIVTLNRNTASQNTVATIPGPILPTAVIGLGIGAEEISESAGGQFTDEEIAAFIDNHFNTVVRDDLAQPTRFVITEKSNRIFVEYNVGAGNNERILLTVRGVIHPEWVITARYQSVRGEWVKSGGDSLPDPKPARIYEWEPSVEQWILKSEL